ncbi:hypothetical protein BTZ20_0833 [Rhodococcus sp. MTM3W5.2]|nr:hypothetical protein BTZ20_0833 [Rhodococcus sp. MTM3W5.2]
MFLGRGGLRASDTPDWGPSQNVAGHSRRRTEGSSMEALLPVLMSSIGYIVKIATNAGTAS